MDYLKAFLVGGIICLLAQLLIDYTKLTPAKILVSFVVLGVILGGFGLYEPLVKFAGAGASVPLLGFGNTLAIRGETETAYCPVCNEEAEWSKWNGTTLSGHVYLTENVTLDSMITIPAGGFAFSFYYNQDNTANQELYDIYAELISGLEVYNQTVPVVDSTTYQFVKDGDMLAVVKNEKEEEESSEEEEESSEEAPAESSEEEEESSEEAPAESSEEEKTSAPSTSAPATSDPAPVDDGAPIGLIVGIVAGVAVIAVVVVLLIKRKK